MESVRDILVINNSLGIGLTETWLTEEVEDAEIQIEDYSELTGGTGPEEELLPT